MSSKKWNSFSEFHRYADYSEFTQEHRNSIGKIPFSIFNTESLPHQFTDPKVNEVVLILPLSVENGCQWTWDIFNRKVTQKTVPGKMLVMPPNVESNWNVTGKRKVLAVCIPDSSFKLVLQDGNTQNLNSALWNLSSDTWEDSFIETSILKIWKHSLINNNLDKFLLDSLISTIIIELMIKSNIVERRFVKSTFSTEKISKMKNFIEENLTDNISINNLAEIMGCSTRHFARVFYQNFNITPHKWITNYKIEKVKKLLLETDDNIYLIAEICGFANQGHLTKYFKNSTNLTPKEWRKQSKL